MAEGGSIVYTASVNAPVTGSPVIVTLANGQTITIPVGQSSSTVTTPVSNDVYQGLHCSAWGSLGIDDRYQCTPPVAGA